MAAEAIGQASWGKEEKVGAWRVGPWWFRKNDVWRI
jgi:hypothetical protein